MSNNEQPFTHTVSLTLTLPPLPSETWSVLGGGSNGMGEITMWENAPWLAMIPVGRSNWTIGCAGGDEASIYAVDIDHPDAQEHRDAILELYPDVDWPEPPKPSLWGTQEAADRILAVFPEAVGYAMDDDGKAFAYDTTPFTCSTAWKSWHTFSRMTFLDNRFSGDWRNSWTPIERND